jgi:predicted RNase H-like HicB family nuclease
MFGEKSLMSAWMWYSMDAMNGSAKTYLFKVVIEDDSHEDGRQAYHAYCPALEQYGASTWGNTKEEALQHIQEVVQMIVEELIDEGALLPEGALQDVEVFSEPRIAVTV